MKDKIPVLTIAIPTFNRVQCLSELLDNLLEEISQLQNKSLIEIIVSDNASSEDVLSVIEHYRLEGLSVKYTRNDNNIGMDGNFHKCQCLANGRYFWMFGDDDLIVKGSLNKIIDMLTSEKDINIISLGCKAKVATANSNSGLLNDLTIRYVNEYEFISNVGVMISFISSIIVKNNKQLSNNDISKFYGTNLIQLFWILKAIRTGTGLVIVDDKLVYAAVDNTGGYKLFTVFSESFTKIVDHYYPRQSPENILMRRKLINFLLYFIGSPKKQIGFCKESYLPVCDKVFWDISRYKYLLRYCFKYPLLAKAVVKLKSMRNEK